MKKIITVISIASILVLGSCKKETNTPKQASLLAKEILGKWEYRGTASIKKNGAILLGEVTDPSPIYNFLDNGTYGTNLSTGIFPYQIKNDTVINFTGSDVNIESHQYTVKIVYNNNDTIMEWIGYPPFITRDGDPNLDHILISFNRIP